MRCASLSNGDSRSSVVPDPSATHGDTVSFTLQDVVSPDLRPLFEHVGPNLRVSGQIVFMSDSGMQKDHFAVVEIDGMYTPLIVPVARLSFRGMRDVGAVDLFRDDGILSCGTLAGDVEPGRDLP